jgi:hypothetical protein
MLDIVRRKWSITDSGPSKVEVKALVVSHGEVFWRMDLRIYF